jgi:hypothetical protein
MGLGKVYLLFLLMQTLLPQAPATASTRFYRATFLFLFLFFFPFSYLFSSFFLFLSSFLDLLFLSFLPSFIYFCSPFARARGKE